MRCTLMRYTLMRYTLMCLHTHAQHAKASVRPFYKLNVLSEAQILICCVKE